jgi:hypothetical protein
MAATLAGRFGAMDEALAEAQRLTIERFAETNALRAQLDRTQAALGDAQMLAQQRFADLEALRERPASPDAGQATQQASTGTGGLRRWLRSRL